MPDAPKARLVDQFTGSIAEASAAIDKLTEENRAAAVAFLRLQIISEKQAHLINALRGELAVVRAERDTANAKASQ